MWFRLRFARNVLVCVRVSRKTDQPRRGKGTQAGLADVCSCSGSRDVLLRRGPCSPVRDPFFVLGGCALSVIKAVDSLAREVSRVVC